MTYNEWRDELKTNLLSFSESERRRVLDYYAEAYADRRDAGYSEREIIQEFGAPYDAARRLLDEGDGYTDRDYGRERGYTERDRRRDDKYERRREEELRREEERSYREAERRRNEDLRREEERRRDEERLRRRDDHLYKHNNKSDYGWVFVLLCIIFCIPLFVIIIGMVGVTIGFFVAPFALLISGVATAGMGVGELAGGNISGLCTLGTGLIVFGVSIILMPLMGKIVKLMWKLFGWIMKTVKGFFSEKESV